MYGQISKHSHDKYTEEEGIYATQEVLPAVQRKGRAAAGAKDGGMTEPPRVLTPSFTHLKGDAGVVQRKPFTQEDIIKMAGDRGCPKEAITKEVVSALLKIVNPIENSYYIYTSMWNMFGSSEPHNIINSVLDMIKAQYDAGVSEPGDVINSVLTMMQAQIGKGGDNNIKGAKDVAGMFSDTELFDISKGKKEFTSLAGIMKALDGKQRAVVLGCMLELQACCTVDGVGKVVEGALVNVNKSLLDKGAQNGEDSQVYTEAFVERMKKMTIFVKKAYIDIESRHKGKYEIEPTGSDPHEGGKHALFLVDKENGEKRVYKPRSMAVDNALTGAHGMLALINGNEKNSDYTLPVMEIDPKDNTEEFVNKKGSFTEEEAGRYYFKMGMLECAGSVMGVTDLHQDNIMPTAGGPVIIDAECAFAYFGGTGLSDALTGSQVAIGLREPVAMFDIQPQKKGEQPEKSTQAFSQDGDKNKYRKQYKEGFNFMLQRLKKRFEEKDFVDKGVGGVLAGVDRVRVVPVSTKDFANMMHTYIGADLKIRQLVIEDLCKEVCDDLDNGEYAFNTEDKGGGMEIDKKLLAEGIKAAFDARTIPAFELDVNKGILYMDGVAIGKSPLGGDMKKAIMNRMGKKLQGMSPEKI
ncbi:uncharacterized protein DUF4135 [Anaerobacterium chartisolvens]|uniref:Uncharacterized protein DUF4135 n=1 Tax=Anaerobacterium chartisolvens TaxID=1297424 RepID=A0A369AT21_9FIRM|nr:DUF4135 domain-containing protein [Anaerobacterium chartisolvens]RCX11377.1 uncharacterized protein DUF4135 [Anaerobacterium chartisolvens]